MLFTRNIATLVAQAATLKFSATNFVVNQRQATPTNGKKTELIRRRWLNRSMHVCNEVTH